jgi:hypothetical protein
MHFVCNLDWKHPNGIHHYPREEKQMKNNTLGLALFYSVLIYFSYCFTKAFHTALEVIMK